MRYFDFLPLGQMHGDSILDVFVNTCVFSSTWNDVAVKINTPFITTFSSRRKLVVGTRAPVSTQVLYSAYSAPTGIQNTHVPLKEVGISIHVCWMPCIHMQNKVTERQVLGDGSLQLGRCKQVWVHSLLAIDNIQLLVRFFVSSVYMQVYERMRHNSRVLTSRMYGWIMMRGSQLW